MVDIADSPFTQFLNVNIQGKLFVNGVPFSGSNIYSADGTLAGNRTVTQGGFTLTFDESVTATTLNTTNFIIGSSSPFSDSAGTLTLQNIDVLDATTATTIGASLTALPNLVQSGALNAGSITSGFGIINNGSSAITTTGLISGGTATVTGLITGGAANITGDLAVDTDTLFVDTGSNEVGINTLTPDTSLHVVSSAADTTAVTTIETMGSNAGETAKFVGDRDPEGNVTASGGAEYFRDSGALSATFESMEATTGTEWFRRAVNPSNIVEIHNTAQFEALATAGTITISTPTTLVLKNQSSIVTSTVFNVVAGGELGIVGADSPNGSTIVYIGTGTFITSVDDVSLTNRARIVSGSSGTFINMTDGRFVFNFSTITAFSTLGSITNGDFIMGSSAFVFYGSPLILTDTSLTSSFPVAAVGGLLFDFRHDALSAPINANIILMDSLLLSSSPIRVDPFLADDTVIQLSSSSSGSSSITLFDTSGTTGTYTAVADNSLAPTAITSVTDNSGVAVFNVASAPVLGSEVVISGYVTNVDYNGTFIVSARTATTFQATVGGSEIVFGSDEATGSVLSVCITVTATAHGLSNGDTLQLDSSFTAGVRTTDYDNGYTIFNVQTNSFDVSATFVATQIGTWDTSGTDQANPNVLNFQSLQGEDSTYIATAFVNNNTTANGAITNGVFTDILFGTSGNALVEGTSIERWKLVDEIRGVFECTSNELFDGDITFDFTSESSGGTQEFRYKWLIDTGSGFADLPDAVEALAAIGSSALSVTKTFPLRASKGDQIKPQVTRDSGSSGITTRYATIYAPG